MSLTFIDIYNSTASQAWSMFDDEVPTKDEFENVLVSSINKALSDLWCSTDFSFRRKTDEIIIMEDNIEYDLPDGNLVPRNVSGKLGYEVSIDGKYLDLIDKPNTLSNKKGKPESFYLDGEYLCFYPIPDKTYDVKVDYYTLAIGVDKKGNPIYSLKDEEDCVDIPEKLEQIFKNALITKAMLYSIASDSDENYSNYKKQYEIAYKLLLKYSNGVKPNRKVRF